MEIYINEDFRLTSDGGLNYIIQKRDLVKSTKEGVPDRYEWRNDGYHGGLRSACLSLLDRVPMQSTGAEQVQTLISELNRLTETIVEAVHAIGEKAKPSSIPCETG